jgi:isoaspartyl peptidase/L-asparaginase-like protein (Ntn-hydrolase superfamily)
MYDKSDSLLALHRRAVRLSRAPSVTAALVAAMCGTAGIAQADPTPADGPGSTINSDGTCAVGTEIAPGTSRSAGSVRDKACYWKRLNGSTIVDNALSRKPQVVQIGSGDTAFMTDYCQPWQKLDCAASCLPANDAPDDVVGELRSFLASHQ